VKVKSRPSDFRVTELLDERYVIGRGEHRVYRVRKRKLTSLEAAARLADLAEVSRSAVGMAGLKDRQGVTVQYMSVPGGRTVTHHSQELSIDFVGFARDELEAKHSLGNAFDVVVRDVPRDVLRSLPDEVESVRRHGLPNYFDRQRFGNVRFGQGWIVLDLVRGRHEEALRRLICTQSEQDTPRMRRAKRELAERWGHWRRCLEVARRFGDHRSLFSHLTEHPGDVAGAFRFVSSRVRLIHLYAYQSHLWNRAVADLVFAGTKPGERRVLGGVEGPLVFPLAAFEPPGSRENRFRIPGAGLEDVRDPRQYELLADVLARDRLVPDQLRIEGVPGFALKGEDRELLVRPARLRFREESGRGGLGRVGLAFELPRGSYATLVLRRLFGEFEAERAHPSGHRECPRDGHSRRRTSREG
jgi:tRNA pseudouridine13 synthase